MLLKKDEVVKVFQNIGEETTCKTKEETVRKKKRQDRTGNQDILPLLF